MTSDIQSDPDASARDRTARLSLASIEAAARDIDPAFRNSPQYICEPLGEALGTEVLVKIETANPIRNFKGRGADWFVSSRDAGSHIVTASAGNLGQAMAYACRKRGVHLTVFASVNANPLKIQRMRALGAQLRLEGGDFDAAKSAAKRYCQAAGVPMVEDGREPKLTEGAGTIAVELLRFPQPMDIVLVALGNGAMLAGIGRYLKARAPSVQVIGVAAAGAPCMERSWRTGTPVALERVDTIADGLATRIPIPEALDDLTGVVDDIVLVDDDRMIEGMRLAHRHLGLVLEPSGAAGIAAMLADPARFAGRRVATVLCGGNLTPEQVAQWIL